MLNICVMHTFSHLMRPRLVLLFSVTVNYGELWSPCILYVIYTVRMHLGAFYTQVLFVLTLLNKSSKAL